MKFDKKFFSHFRSLIIVDLSYNSLSKIPGYLFKLKYIKELNLQNNYINYIQHQLSLLTNLEKLNAIFCKVFSVESSVLGEDFNKDNVDGWDSVHQLNLTSSVEDEFDIMLDAEDILEFTSYNQVKAILAKYEIEL